MAPTDTPQRYASINPKYECHSRTSTTRRNKRLTRSAPRTPVTAYDYVYRVAGMVPGPRPYVLVTDDLKKNDSILAYSWRLLLAQDLSPANVTVRQLDAMITDTANTPTRRLLVRLLRPPGVQDNFKWEVKTYNNATTKSKGPIHMLAGDVHASSASFKVMLFPLAAGDVAPVTTWVDANTVHLTKPDGSSDAITFFTDAEEEFSRIAVRSVDAAVV